MSREQRDHYSEKGGHQARGDASKIERQFRRQFPNVPYIKPEGQIARRSMRRITQDGRGNPRQAQ